MRTRHALARTALGVFVVLPHFIMERKMMLTIKACAESCAPTVPRLERSEWCSRGAS